MLPLTGKRMASPPTASDVATAVVELSTKPEQSRGKLFVVSSQGL